MLFVKGFIIGLGKIIPGVSGALLAINFGVYERLINVLTTFFDDWKRNIQFLIIITISGLLGIILGSKGLLFLFNNYQFQTLMFFDGLIIGGTYIFGKKINYTKKGLFLLITVILMTSLSFLFMPKNSVTNSNVMLIIGGYIEIFASIVPGISATSLLMILGIYNQVLTMISNIADLGYVIFHFKEYIYFGIGMFLSFVLNLYLIKYCLQKYRNISYIVILGLAISSVIFLLLETFKLPFNIFGFGLFIAGIMVNKYFV